MLSRWVRYLALLTLACGQSEHDECNRPDYSICGSPLPEADDSGMPWLSYSQDLLEICGDDTLIEASLGYCDDGKRVLNRSNGFGVDTRFYAAETLVGRRSQGDVLFIVIDAPECICSGLSFQGTLDSVHCRVTRAELLCGRPGPSAIADRTLSFAPSLGPGACFCEGAASTPRD